MTIKLTKKQQGDIAIAGHVGCGHTHSLNNQAQDDSAGLSVVLRLFKEATGLSLNIKEFIFEDNKITTVLENGGTGYGIARRGISTQEKRMIQNLVGKEVINTHTLVLDIFGRIYGQGVLETPVALQTSLANAALNSFELNFPEYFRSTTEDLGDNHGKMVGTVLNIDGADISVLGTVNATAGGLGPNEDLEGNSPYYAKKEIIESLGMDKLPTIIIEAKVSSSFSQGLTESTFFVRADEEDDNIVVLESILKAGEDLGIPILHFPGTMKRTPDALRNNTKAVARKIVELGVQLSNAETSEEKVNIVGELALVVSQDCGGITFMSNDLHEELGGAGMIQKTGAVINIVVTPEYAKENPIPYLTDEDIDNYVKLVLESAKNLYNNREKAQKIITG